MSPVVILIVCILFCVLFSILSIVFMGFSNKVKKNCADLASDAKSAHSWGSICMWLAVIFGVSTVCLGLYISKRSKAGPSALRLPTAAAAPEDTQTTPPA